jgi:hypothetical protein
MREKNNINLKGRHIFGDIEVDETVILKWIIHKYSVRI